ncbi:MAG: UvrD-helicase domain-containing protein [Simkaniaceae bacterium]|nr:UvrD-helicase domain-containing protein [Simkaniaceae bacterium]
MSELNEKQQLAVNHVEGPLLVLAGAGSGKTRVVTYRIASLIKSGVYPSKILALTFTNKAAAEMRTRIGRLTDRHVLTSTFHSLGARILRESASALGYEEDPVIYDEDDTMQLVRNCIDAPDKKKDKTFVKSVRSTISFYKNRLLSPESASDLPDEGLDDALVKRIYARYRDKLKEYNALDFDDLLFMTVTLFRQVPEVLRKYQERWSFISVDEYQDTNLAQYEMIKLLSALTHNVFVVGDPDQSIYSWRGAEIRNILEFEKDYPGARIITLDRNYRSTSHILRGANGVIAHNRSRYEKNLWSALGEGEKIKIRRMENEREEAEFVVETIATRARRDAIPLDECVIFYRTNALSRVLEDRFFAHNIPYVIVGGLSFYQRREVKDILAFLRVTLSDTDFIAFSRTINLPKRGIGNVTLTRWHELTDTLSVPIIPFCRQLLAGEVPAITLTKKQREGLADYIRLIDTLRDMVRRDEPLTTIVRKAVRSSRYMEVLKADEVTYSERKENVEALVNKASEWRHEEEEATLANFIEELSLRSSADVEGTRETVRLMTLHNGKGLEFTLAFIVGMEENLLPHINARDTEEGVEEERRLCYVGMTRAKRLLYLTGANLRLTWGYPQHMRPSRFIGEIPAQYREDLTEARIEV